MVANEKSFFAVACLYVPKRGGSLAIFMYYWKNSGNIHVLLVTSGQHSCPRVNKYSCLIGTLSKQNMYLYTVVKVGGGI